MADMIEILKSPENLRNICISLSASLCLYAIIIHSSKGRISRIEFWKLKAVQFASLAVAFLTIVLFMTKKLPLVLLFSVPIMLFFAIKSLQASVRRLHDLGFSGWFLLLDGKEIFVRSDGFSYRLVYDRNAHVPGLEIQERDCLAREYYNIPVSRSQLKKLLETSAGRPLVISPAR